MKEYGKAFHDDTQPRVNYIFAAMGNEKEKAQKKKINGTLKI